MSFTDSGIAAIRSNRERLCYGMLNGTAVRQECPNQRPGDAVGAFGHFCLQQAATGAEGSRAPMKRRRFLMRRVTGHARNDGRDNNVRTELRIGDLDTIGSLLREL